MIYIYGIILKRNSYQLQLSWIHGTRLWRLNGHEGVSSHQPHNCLLNCVFRRRIKKTSKLRITGLCEGNSPVTGEFPTQRASNAENDSIWWRQHDILSLCTPLILTVKTSKMLIYTYVHKTYYHKISNISGTKSQNLNVSRLVLQLSLPNPMKPGVKSGMKM